MCGCVKIVFQVYIAITAVTAAIVSGNGNDIISDYKNGSLNPFNNNDQVALDSQVLSFYKGRLVIRHSFIDAYFAIGGTIFLYSHTYYDTNDLNHEYGHTIQENLLGPLYITSIDIPSVLYYTFGSGMYYSQPWEHSADMFGGANRGNYESRSLGWSVAYLLFGPGVLIPYYMRRM